MTTSLPGIWSSRRQSGGGSASITWTNRTTGAAGYRLEAAAYNGSVYGVLGARVSATSKFFYSSNNGVTWNGGSTGQFNHYGGSLQWYNSMWVAAGDGGSSQFCKVYTGTSSTLSSWTNSHTTNSHSPTASCIGSSKICVGAINTVWDGYRTSNSSNGTSWTLASDTSLSSGYGQWICGNSDKMVIVNASNSTQTFAHSSNDGDTWTTQTTSSGSGMVSIGCNSTGSKYISVGTSGKCWTSTNGTTWVVRSAISTDNFSRVTYDGTGKWCASTGTGKVFESDDDGVSWTENTTVNVGTSGINFLIYAGGIWMLGTGDGKINTGV